MPDTLHVEITDHIAFVRLNRPEKMNAINLEMFEEFAVVGRELASNTSLRAVVVHGAGDNFCAGIDLMAFQEAGGDLAGDNRMEPRSDSAANFFQSSGYVWREIPVPVIAAVKGVAFGGGTQIALGADIRYAAPDAKFSIMEVKWGIIPDLAISTTAQFVMPADRVKELAFTGRVISGDEALVQGLVTAVKSDPLAAATELATEIAGRNPAAVRAIKKLIDDSWRTQSAEFLRREAELQQAILGTPNQQEAVMANLQKRPPVFNDVES